MSENSICEVREPLPGCVIVTVTGEVDAHSAPRLQEAARSILAGARGFAQGRLSDDACLILVSRR